ncbi:MAG: hypothetical protein ABIE03_03495 [Patescibacteria group bacterium]|nr:hypothetical protein [Patescibacteria group bacterium]
MNLIYTFFNYRNLTFRLSNKLTYPEVSKYYLRGKNSADRLVKYIEKHHFEYILGLGDYRKNSKRIRIEERFMNKYGKNEIIATAPRYYKATWELPILNNKIYISDKPSNGPCNRSAYLISHILHSQNQNTKLAFVHIPKSYKIDKAEGFVNSWIKV